MSNLVTVDALVLPEEHARWSEGCERRLRPYEDGTKQEITPLWGGQLAALGALC